MHVKNKTYTLEEVSSVFHSEEPWVNVFLLRYITVPIAYILVNKTSVTPNWITAVSLVFGLLCALAFSFGFIYLGVVFFLFSYIADAVDGKVARLTKCYSKYGAWFDIFVDRFNFSAFVIGLSIHYADFHEPKLIMLLTGMVLAVFFIGFESRYNIQADELREFVSKNDFDAIKRWKAVAATSYSKGPDSFLSKYRLWASNKGVVASPFTLVEMMFLLFFVSPLLGVYIYALCFSIFILFIRLVMQQRYWF